MRRNHDGFLKYVYSQPKNAKVLLHLSSTANKILAEMLEEVDLETLEEIPKAYDDVDERGEADIAFKVKALNGEDIFFGILLEHKSSPSDDVLAQIHRYAFKVMMNKSEEIFPWMPTKAIIIYNGKDEWDPIAKLANKSRAKFHGHALPFELAFVNLTQLDDELCFAEQNAVASIGILTMKYAFNIKEFLKILPEIERKLNTLEKEQCTTLVSKIELYLGEYINHESLEELKMAFKSIGQRLGFVSAGDERRALEKELREERKRSAAKDSAISIKDSEIAAKDAAISAKDAEIAALKAQLAAK